MSVQVENLEKSTAKLTVEVPAEELDKAIQQAYMKQKKNFSMPGFRKGKVPKQLIEKMYGPEVFYEDAANFLLQANYPEAAKESELKIITRPVIDVTQIEKGKDFIFTAEVGVYPEVELGQYKGVEIPIQNTEVTEADIEAELKAEQEKNSRTVTVDDRPAQMGDTVVIDFLGEIDGVPFEGGEGKDHSLELGSGQFIPGFEEQLVGTKADEKKDVAVKFPEEYHAEDLKGKEAVFHCTVHRIEKKELPELDDDFAQDVSEFDTLDEYKEDLKKSIAERKEKQAKEARINLALEKAADNAKMELSDILVDEQVDNMFENMANRFKAQGMDMQQYLMIMGQTEEQAKEPMRPQALRQLRTQFVLDKIAEVENLEATDEKVEEKLAEMAKAYNMELDKLKEIFSDDYMEQFKSEMKSELAAELVGENAVETEAATKAAEEALKENIEEVAKETVETVKEEAEKEAE